MKKVFLLVVLCTVSAVSVSAWCHPGPPPPCRPWGGYGWGGYYGYNSGLYNAAAITSIVANGLSIYRNLATPVNTTVVVPAATYPVYTAPAPVVVQAPVYTTAPTYVVQSPVPSYVVQQAPTVQTVTPAGTTVVQRVVR